LQLNPYNARCGVSNEDFEGFGSCCVQMKCFLDPKGEGLGAGRTIITIFRFPSFFLVFSLPSYIAGP